MQHHAATPRRPHPSVTNGRAGSATPRTGVPMRCSGHSNYADRVPPPDGVGGCGRAGAGGPGTRCGAGHHGHSLGRDDDVGLDDEQSTMNRAWLPGCVRAQRLRSHRAGRGCAATSREPGGAGGAVAATTIGAQAFAVVGRWSAGGRSWEFSSSSGCLLWTKWVVRYVRGRQPARPIVFRRNELRYPSGLTLQPLSSVASLSGMQVLIFSSERIVLACYSHQCGAAPATTPRLAGSRRRGLSWDYGSLARLSS
jgi:hypothetical protein